MKQKMMIIDGSSLIHRAFYALPLLTTASGQHTNAVYGFATMLVKLLADYKPDAIAVAFDKGRVTFRNEVYGQYKAHRKATPAELSEQFPLVQQLLAAFGITVMEEAGYEGDDIIGTLTAKAVAAGFAVIIVTGDRDALQLLQPAVQVMLTRKGISDMEMFDTGIFKAKYGVEAAQLIDLKGLMGDTSDNIPGVPGIGEKTALKLISEFGTVENLLRNIDQVPGKKLQENLRNNVELAVVSKQLATIITDMPMDFNPDSYKMEPDCENIRALFTRFEFKSLLARMDVLFPGNSSSSPEVEDVSREAPTVCDRSAALAVAAAIRQQKAMFFFPVITGRIPSLVFAGLAVMAAEDQPVYIPAGTEAWDEMLALLADDRIGKVTHEVKSVYAACRQEKVSFAGPAFDTALAAYLIDPTASEYPLAGLREKYLGLSSGQAGKPTIDQGYAAWAVQVIQPLYPVLERKLKELELVKLYYEIELPLVSVLTAMETDGIAIDSGHLAVMSAEIAGKVDGLLSEIYQLAGEEFNVNSTKQLGQILFDKLKLPVIKKTKTGYSTDAEVLEKLAGQHPLIDQLLEYRLLTKLKSTYLDGMQGLVNATTKRIYTSFNQLVTATGRLSSSDPNLQNIPIRSEAGKRIRELFIPGDGYHYLMSADYSQIELRVLAHMSGDANLMDAFRANQDVHTRTAAEVFGVHMNEVTAEMRRRAKAVNFGIVYGISDYGLSRDLGVTRKEAAQYIESYFDKCRGVKAFIDQVVKEAHENGYVTTLFGRRRYLPEINSSNYNQRSFAERTAMNTPIQGTAADVIKKAMIDVYRELTQRQLKSRLLLQVHDELVLEVSNEETAEVSQIVQQAMENAVKLDVPLVADVKLGENWARAK
ncbi:DNA polymerase I|uniref:DNA polymerase I n=1 Tax=Dendrosporobacter quercicolus TaxID=146817 RepID=A0A1G9ZHE5_9FIRM|nr:DNA polymerase I [Dendrosporobacter quercicolus]NSL49813.1 DNA polymerase I [Dendrosporobacter quercicolus DSM 1736]SDN20585.1 DNA polymerase I [Dendrosporobacter quercicolus]